MDEVKRELFRKATIIFTTLSSAGQKFFQSECDFDFDTVIIDEAAQAKEITTLIPLRYGAKRLILIGDTNQLPSLV